MCNGVSDACQIKDLDHAARAHHHVQPVSDACQIKDLDHGFGQVGYRA